MREEEDDCCMPMITEFMWAKYAEEVRKYVMSLTIYTSSLSVKKDILYKYQRLNYDTGRIIVVGDVHGCIEELKSLLIKTDFNKDIDTLVFVGDLINKGPNSQEVVHLAIQLNAITIRGNHEEYCLQDMHSKNSKYTSYKQFDAASLEYMQNMPVMLNVPHFNLVVVHAAVDYKNPTNCINGIKRWSDNYNGSEYIVYGHNSSEPIKTRKMSLNIDTGCVHGGSLTAYILPDKTTVSVKALKVYEKY